MTESIYTKRYDLFRAILIEARRARALSQMALAEQLGRVQTFVSKYERGERRLDIIEFIDVANALGIDPHKVIRQLEAMDGT
jgi:transcriptional regulator with XRE-family HTH domain